MDDYLLIDCVVGNMVASNVIQPKTAWKRTALGTKAYNVDFSSMEVTALSLLVSVLLMAAIIFQRQRLLIRRASFRLIQMKY